MASSRDQLHVLVGAMLSRRRTALGRAARSQVLERFTVVGLADVRTGLERAAKGAG